MTRLLPPVALLSVMLAGCSTPIAGTAEQVCKTWLPISISRSDVLTERTAQEIAGNNAASEQWCGKRPIQRENQRVAKR